MFYVSLLLCLSRGTVKAAAAICQRHCDNASFNTSIRDDNCGLLVGNLQVGWAILGEFHMVWNNFESFEGC